MIPKANLDDRTFKEIKEEAIALIPRYCPEWTNHNDSDPGITLIELFSWMTEMTLYRLNKVPAKTYLAMLELMGLDLTPAQSARTVVEFHVSDTCDKDIKISRGTKITSITSGEDPVIFETEKDLSVRNTRLISCVSRREDKWQENCPEESRVRTFNLFGVNGCVEHILYIKSESFAYLSEGHGIQLAFQSDIEVSSSEDEITKHLAFEYWNGKEWLLAESLPSMNGAKAVDNVVYIKGPYEISPVEVNGTEGLFLRAVLTDVPKNHGALRLKGLLLRNVFCGEGFSPDLCMSNRGKVYDAVDQNNAFRMFGETPVMNDMFYIACDEVFCNRGTKATVRFAFSELGAEEAANENATFSYEYWDGHDWKKLTVEGDGLMDETFSFRQGGKVSFIIPNDIEETDVDNESHIYIRIRLLPKDFAVGGRYAKNIYGESEWQFDAKVQSPLIEKIRVSYEPHAATAQNVFAYTDFKWRDESEFFSAEGHDEAEDVFVIEDDSLPSLYLGLSGQLSSGEFNIYFRVNENRRERLEPNAADKFILPPLEEEAPRELTLEWNCLTADGWKKIDFSDGTDSFHESGYVCLRLPEKVQKASMFGREGCWIRCVMKNGSFELPPVIEGIVLNSVYAENAERHTDETVGSGSGAPGQRFRLAHENVLGGISIKVKEDAVPSSNEIEMMRLDGIEDPVEVTDDGAWVKYREVPNFYSSTPFSRHYTVNYSTGEILFGDGIRGMNPPNGSFNIKAVEYKTGGGTGGNVAAHRLQYLTRSIPYITGCDNPYPGEGGSEMEDLDNLKKRAAGVFKSLERAVAKEDFEWLSMKASGAVGRAYCLKESRADGSIRTLIIPKMPQDGSLDAELMPSRELVRRVKQYLEERKLVGTKISVGSPIYRRFSLKLVITLRGGAFNADEEKQSIERNLASYFHPLIGGSGSGWEFRKDVSAGIVLKQLEKIPSIVSVKDIIIRDLDAGMDVEVLPLNDGELPALRGVEIVEGN